MAKRLRGAEVGTFLVRITAAGDGLVVSVVKTNGIFHIKVEKTSAGFFFDTNKNAVTHSLVNLISQNAEKLSFISPFTEGSPFAEVFAVAAEMPDTGIYLTAGQANNF